MYNSYIQNKGGEIMHSKIDDEAMEELRKLSQKEKNVKQKKRYDVVIAHYEGYKHEIISELLHVSRRSITQYVSDYKKGGIDALLIKKQSGRPKYLTEDQEKELYNIIATMTPEETGVGIFANWTAPLACCLVKQKYGITFKERGMRDLFKSIGLSYTRPTYTLEKADTEKQNEFRENFEVKKRTFK